MKKLHIFTLLLAALLLSACGAKEETPVEVNDQVISDVMADESTAENTPSEQMTEGETTTDSDSLSISSGTVSYTVQKGWLSKPSETVVSSTSSVNGSVKIDVSTASVEASIDPATLNSGSGGRDKDAAGMLGAKITISGSGIALDANLANLNLTINGTTLSVPFTVSIEKTGDSYKASGSANILMSSFGINPPSAIGIYNVMDETVISFDITAS